MGKHYKAFGVAVLILAGIALLLFLIPRLSRSSGSEQYRQTVEYYAAVNRLDPALVMAVIKTESNFDPEAISHAEAYGLMQITEETLKWAIYREGKGETYTTEDLLDPKINIRYGCLILSLLMDEFQDPATALSAYNAGRGNTLKWLKDSRYSKDGKTIQTTPFQETNQYIEKVLKYREKYSGGQE